MTTTEPKNSLADEVLSTAKAIGLPGSRATLRELRDRIPRIQDEFNCAAINRSHLRLIEAWEAAVAILECDHVFLDGDDLLGEIREHPRCPHCSATPGIVVLPNGDWEAVTTHVGECATRSLA